MKITFFIIILLLFGIHAFADNGIPKKNKKIKRIEKIQKKQEDIMEKMMEYQSKRNINFEKQINSIRRGEGRVLKADLKRREE